MPDIYFFHNVHDKDKSIYIRVLIKGQLRLCTYFELEYNLILIE